MNTLMSASTFQELSAFREQFPKSFRRKVAGVFVPWAGSRLVESGGLYYVGMATRGEFGGNCADQSFGARVEETRNELRNSQSGTPFWSYLNCLSKELLNEPYKNATDSLGWSNLLKIGFSEETYPPNWPTKPTKFLGEQTGLCVAAFREELFRLKNTVIVITSNPTFGVLDGAVDSWASVKWKDWDKSYETKDGIWWWWDERKKNLYVHGYHPNYAKVGNLFNEMLNRTVMLVRKHQQEFSWLRRR